MQLLFCDPKVEKFGNHFQEKQNVERPSEDFKDHKKSGTKIIKNRKVVVV